MRKIQAVFVGLVLALLVGCSSTPKGDGSIFRGKVVDEFSRPIVGVEVLLVERDSTKKSLTTTDSNGDFETRIPARAYEEPVLSLRFHRHGFDDATYLMTSVPEPVMLRNR